MSTKKKPAKKAAKKAPVGRGKRAASTKKPPIDKSAPWPVPAKNIMSPSRKTGSRLMAEFGIGSAVAIGLVAAEIETFSSLDAVKGDKKEAGATVVMNWQDEPVFAEQVMHFMYKCYYDDNGAKFDLDDLDLGSVELMGLIEGDDENPKG